MILIKFLLLVAAFPLMVAFQLQPSVGDINGVTRATTRLDAWSLPSSVGNTWYQECDPTYRRTSYDDTPFEYNYVSLDDDWNASIAPFRQEEEPKMPEKSARNLSPLRFAARLARRIRRQD